ncbi:MAG: hypothetical protein WD733_04535 [Bryobacterales bacterium]
MASQSPDPSGAAKAGRIGDGPQPPRRPLIPRWVRLLLYPVFSVLLFLPALRWLRRDSGRWNRVRFVVGTASMAAVCFGAWWGVWWIAALGTLGLATALLMAPSRDPDRERELQRRHGADYLLNGGRLISAWPEDSPGKPQPGTRLYLLLRGELMLAVPVESCGEVSGSIQIASIDQILVGGASYLPVYISEAKDPPVREQSVDRKSKTVMALVMAGGERVEFEYEGAFSKHLAETAAHAIFSVRKLGTAHGVAGQSPEIFHIVGR